MHPFHRWIFAPLRVFSGAHNSGPRDSPDPVSISGLFGWSAIVFSDMAIAMRSISWLWLLYYHVLITKMRWGAAMHLCVAPVSHSKPQNGCTGSSLQATAFFLLVTDNYFCRSRSALVAITPSTATPSLSCTLLQLFQSETPHHAHPLACVFCYGYLSISPLWGV
jgi:hypothetical protein